MNDLTQTLVRSVLKIFGGYLVAHGIIDDSGVEVATAAALAIAGVVWGAMHRTPPPSSSGGKVPLLMLALAVGGLVTLETGCKSSPQRVEYQLAGGSAITVEAAMGAWGDYVATAHPPADEEKKVLALFNHYQATMDLVIDAEEAYIAMRSAGSTNLAGPSLQANAAAQEAAKALAGLIELLRSYGLKL